MSLPWRPVWRTLRVFQGTLRIVHFLVKRAQPGSRRVRWALLAGMAVLAAGGGIAAPGLGFAAMLGMPRDGYAVRFALPVARRVEPLPASPAARTATLAGIATPPPVAPVAEASPVALAAVTALPAPTAARARLSKVPGVIALNYSLAGGANAGDSIEVDKPVSIAGADAGRIPIRIDGNAKVYAQGKKLAAMIALRAGETAVPAGLGDDFISLEALRALGIGVKYDAIHDRLMLDPPGA
jgi:hypothetical protein